MVCRRGARRPRRPQHRLRAVAFAAGSPALPPGRRPGAARDHNRRPPPRSGGLHRGRLAGGTRGSRAAPARDPAGDRPAAAEACAAAGSGPCPLARHHARLRPARGLHPLAPGPRLARAALSDGAGPPRRDSGAGGALARRRRACDGARARPGMDPADARRDCANHRIRPDRAPPAAASGRTSAYRRARAGAPRPRSAPALLTPAAASAAAPATKGEHEHEPNLRARTRARRRRRRRLRPRLRLERAGPRRDQSAGRKDEDERALHACRSDRERKPDDHEGRADAAERLRHRLFPALRGLEAGCPIDGIRREHADPEGDVERRQGPDRRGRRLPVPRQPRLEQDLPVQRATDVLGRLPRRLDGPGVVGHPGADDRGQVLARQRGQLDTRNRRPRRRRGWRGSGRDRPRDARRQPAARMKRTLLTVLAATVASLALPGAAWAHAALLQTTPVASRVLNGSPKQVALRYSEPVEPRFAIVSVTSAAGEQQTVGSPRRSPTDADTLVVPLKRLPEGWYLVYWRVISVDGHPVRGAFTFAVGPNAGPAPQFVIPSVSETAATPKLVAARWLAFLSMMTAIGLFVLRIAIARPLVARVTGTRLRHVSIAFAAASVLALVAIPVYFLLATAEFALRSFWSFAALFPLVRISAFGRGWVDLELVFALFSGAAAIAIWLDRPERPQRSIAAILALTGAVGAGAAALLVPGTVGHAGQNSPRGLSLAFDWLHLVAGPVWVGGLIGLVVLAASRPAARRVAALVVCVPRFSTTALVSVLVLIGAGIGSAVEEMP